MLNVNNLKNRGNNLSLDLAVRNIIRRQSQAFNGVWYDPSDLSTLFQDSAGATPVTAAGQPVGLILDKSRGLELGAQLFANSDFAANLAGWTINNPAFVTAGVNRVVFSGAPDSTIIYQDSTTPAGKRWKLTFTVLTVSSGSFASRVNGITGTLRTAPGTYTEYLTSRTLPSCGVISVGASTTGEITNVEIREVLGNHATISTTGFKPLYQKSGNLSYLEFDGLDDFLVTGNIDFSGSDKVAVAAGLRKTSDAATGIFCELGTGNQNGSFYITAPGLSGTNKFGFSARGTVDQTAATTSASFSAPISKVISGRAFISADNLGLRANGMELANVALDLGAGNYGNYPLYIGRRVGTAFPFKGNLYGLCVLGGLDDIYKLKKVEQYLAAKTGVII